MRVIRNVIPVDALTFHYLAADGKKFAPPEFNESEYENHPRYRTERQMLAALIEHYLENESNPIEGAVIHLTRRQGTDRVSALILPKQAALWIDGKCMVPFPLHHDRKITVVTAGDKDWEPTPAELENLRSECLRLARMPVEENAWVLRNGISVRNLMVNPDDVLVASSFLTHMDCQVIGQAFMNTWQKFANDPDVRKKAVQAFRDALETRLALD